MSLNEPCASLIRYKSVLDKYQTMPKIDGVSDMLFLLLHLCLSMMMCQNMIRIEISYGEEDVELQHE